MEPPKFRILNLAAARGRGPAGSRVGRRDGPAVPTLPGEDLATASWGPLARHGHYARPFGSPWHTKGEQATPGLHPPCWIGSASCLARRDDPPVSSGGG